MGKASRRKKLFKDVQVGYVREPCWEEYDILEVHDDAIVARRKSTGLVTVFFPVAPWEVENIQVN